MLAQGVRKSAIQGRASAQNAREGQGEIRTGSKVEGWTGKRVEHRAKEGTNERLPS
jgi:hypothetical protein